MIRRKDLSDIGDNDHARRAGEILLCGDCLEELGGPTRGDLWNYDMDHILRCSDCDSTNLSLVRIREDYITVKE